MTLCGSCIYGSPEHGETADGRRYPREYTTCKWTSGWVVKRRTRCEGYRPRDGSTLGVVGKHSKKGETAP